MMTHSSIVVLPSRRQNVTRSAPSGGVKLQLGGSTSQPSKGSVGAGVGKEVGPSLGVLDGVNVGHSPQKPK